MRRRTQLRLALVAAALAVMVAPAFACVVYVGKMAVTPHWPGSGTVSTVGDTTYMGWCATEGAASVPQGSLVVINVAVAQGVCASGTYQMVDGAYVVSFLPGPGPCMDPVLDPGARGILAGRLVVDSAGSGSGHYTIPALAEPSDTIGVCVTGPADAGQRGITVQGGEVRLSVI